MLAMFGIWTFILSYIAVTKERLDFAMLAGFALGGAWLTKSPALFFALMLPTLWLFIKSPSGPEALRAGGLIHFLKIFGLTIVTVIIGYGMYNILRLGPNWSMIASRNLDYVYPFSHLLTSPFDPLKPFLLQAWQWIVMMGPWLLMVFGLIGYLVNWKKHWKATIVLTVWFFAPIFAQAEFAKVFTARYILFTVPFLIIVVSSAFLETRKVWSKILIVILAIFMAQSLVFDYYLLISPEKANLPRSERSGYLEEWTAGQGIYEISQYLKDEQKANPDEKIIVGTEGYFGTLPDALQAYMNDTPSVTVIGIGLTFDGIPPQLVNAKKAGDKIYLVVNKSRFGHEPSKDGLKIVGEYPKGVRPDGSQDSLLFMGSI
jgi:hypothetical protein